MLRSYLYQKRLNQYAFLSNRIHRQFSEKSSEINPFITIFKEKFTHSDQYVHTGQSVIDVFEAVAVQQGSKNAMTEVNYATGTQSLITKQISYQDLNHKSNQLARVLHSRHALRKGQVVAMRLPTDQITSRLLTLATWKAGGCVFNIDSRWNPEAIAETLAEINPALILDHRNQFNTGDLTALLSESEGESKTDIQQQDLLHQPAFIAKSSGTTGKPKIIRIPHYGLVDIMQYMAQDISKITDKSITVQISPPSFVAYMVDLLIPMLNGASLVIPPSGVVTHPEAFIDLIEEFRISHLTITPALCGRLFNAWHADYPRLQSLQSIMLVGEDPPKKVLNTLFAYKKASAKQDLIIANAYGLAEVSTCASATRLYQESDGHVPLHIGTGGRGTDLRVMAADDQKQWRLITPGESGTLFIAGPGVTQSAYTQEEFNKNFIYLQDEVTGKKQLFFNTGDRVQLDDDYRLVFSGRENRDQLRLSGRLIDLREIAHKLEATLQKITNKTPEVWVHYNEELHKIVAYTLGKDLLTMGKDFSAMQDLIVKAVMLSGLDNYQVPEFYWIDLEDFPMREGGKVDFLECQRVGKPMFPFNHFFEQIHENWIKPLSSPKKQDATNLLLKIGRVFAEYQIMDPELTLTQQGIDSLGTFDIREKLKSTFPDLHFEVGTIINASFLELVAYIFNKHELNVSAVPRQKRWHLSDFQLDKSIIPNAKSTKPDLAKPQNVLVTGAAGLAGSHLVKQLIMKKNIGQIYVLVRAGSRAAAKKRVLDRVKNSIRHDPQLSPAERERWASIASDKLIAINGDVHHKDLGIEDREMLDRIRQQVSVIFHTATTVNVVDSVKKQIQFQVGAVTHLLSFISTCSLEVVLIHTSSLAAIGHLSEDNTFSDASIPTEECGVLDGPGYYVAKAACERVIFQAIARGFKAYIMRPGFMYQGVADVNLTDLWSRVVIASVQLGKYPLFNQLRQGFLSADEAAHYHMALMDKHFQHTTAEQPLLNPPIFHAAPSGTDNMTTDTFLDIIGKVLQQHNPQQVWKGIPFQQWLVLVYAEMAKNTVLRDRISPILPYFAMQGRNKSGKQVPLIEASENILLDNSRSYKVLAVDPPKPMDEESATHYLATLGLCPRPENLSQNNLNSVNSRKEELYRSNF